MDCLSSCSIIFSAKFLASEWVGDDSVAGATVDRALRDRVGVANLQTLTWQAYIRNFKVSVEDVG